MSNNITSSPACGDNSPDVQVERHYLHAEVIWLKRAESLEGSKFQPGDARHVDGLRRDHRLNNPLRATGIVQSISIKGNCLDNAMIERFCRLTSVYFYPKEFERIPVLRGAINACHHA